MIKLWLYTIALTMSMTVVFQSKRLLIRIVVPLLLLWLSPIDPLHHRRRSEGYTHQKSCVSNFLSITHTIAYYSHQSCSCYGCNKFLSFRRWCFVNYPRRKQPWASPVHAHVKLYMATPVVVLTRSKGKNADLAALLQRYSLISAEVPTVEKNDRSYKFLFDQQKLTHLLRHYHMKLSLNLRQKSKLHGLSPNLSDLWRLGTKDKPPFALNYTTDTQISTILANIKSLKSHDLKETHFSSLETVDWSHLLQDPFLNSTAELSHQIAPDAHKGATPATSLPSGFHYVALTSPDAVESFVQCWIAAGCSPYLRFAVVGKSTKKALLTSYRKQGLEHFLSNRVFVPSRATAATLAAELPPCTAFEWYDTPPWEFLKQFAKPNSQTVLLWPTSNQAPNTLKENLENQRKDSLFSVIRLNLYDTSPIPSTLIRQTFSNELNRVSGLLNKTLSEVRPIVAFGSGSAVKAWIEAMGTSYPAVCIGETTGRIAKQNGMSEVKWPTSPGLAQWAKCIYEATHPYT